MKTKSLKNEHTFITVLKRSNEIRRTVGLDPSINRLPLIEDKGNKEETNQMFQETLIRLILAMKALPFWQKRSEKLSYTTKPQA